MFDQQPKQLPLAFDPEPDVVTITTKPASNVAQLVAEFRAGARQSTLCDRYGLESEQLTHLLSPVMAATAEPADAAIERLSIVADPLASAEATT